MYNYETQKAVLFTDEGQRLFLTIRGQAFRMLGDAGAFRLDKAILGIAGDTWDALACIDRMVELGELLELSTDGPTQHRVFVKG